MSYPDYGQHAEDHQALLILVKDIGPQINQKTFNKVYDQISKVQYVRVQDSHSSGGKRAVWLRYRKKYSVENNDWGDFQAHRKVLGLLCVGKCNSQEELEDLCKFHTILQEKYGSTLVDSRCLVFGMESASSAASSRSTSPEKVYQEEASLTSPLFDGQSPEDDPRSPSIEESHDDLFRTCLVPVPVDYDGCEDKDSGVFEPSSSGVDHDSLASSRNREVSPPQSSGSVSPQEEQLLPLEHHLLDAPLSPLLAFDHLDDGPVENFSDPLLSLTHNQDAPDSLEDHNQESSSGNECSSLVSLGLPVESRKLMIPPTVKSRSIQCILYPNLDHCKNLEQDLVEFVSSLFWVVESKRLDRSFEKQDKVPLLTAPFEKKNFVGLDGDSKFKKRCVGRMRKHIGDLALQAGMPLEALFLYLQAIDYLKSVNDWLWLASAYEGQCAASIILLYPPHRRSVPLHRNLSFHMKKTARTKTSGVHTRSLPNGVEPSDFKSLGRGILSPAEIVEKYRDAVSNYRRYRQMGIVETECRIKATRVLILIEKCLEASEMLQNIYYVGSQQSEEEKIHRYCVLSELYSEIGFWRKAAFYKRMAACHSYSVQDSTPNWNQCYHLMLQTLEGYKISFDWKKYPKGVMYGWPQIQKEILQDLVLLAKKMGNQALAVRHMAFLLHSMFDYLMPADRKEFCGQLETLAYKCEGAPVPLALESGYIIPPVNLLNIPRVKTFRLLNLAPHLRPVKIENIRTKTKVFHGPFIFSPLQNYKETEKKSNNKLDFKWVEGDVSEVALQVFNPLPFELKVSHMGLLADGIAFECFPACLSLPAESGPYPVNLLGLPHSMGELHILGYTTHVLGLKSNCMLRDLDAIRKPAFVIDVIPSLPQLEVSTSFPKASTFSSLGDTSHVVISAAVTLYAGESRECTITLMNTGKEPVEMVDISLDSVLDGVSKASFFSWSKENLDTQLPLSPGSSASFTLYINAVGNFVIPRKGASRQDVSSPAHLVGRGHTSRASCSSPAESPLRKATVTISSPELFTPKVIEAVIQLQYTGGPGMKSQYCRQCGIALTVEVLPSIVITKWDVLPAEMPTHCYLVLDLLNATTQEMELHYAAHKQILIEARETCRIPVPVERCPLSSVDFLREGFTDGSDVLAQKLVEVCCQHLTNLVDLRWILPNLEVHGRASIAEVTWTPAMLDAILMSPLQWEIKLNEETFKAEEELTFPVGDPITLCIAIINQSDITLRKLHLSIRGYQDYQNGHYSYRLENKRAVIGCDKVFIEEIPPQETYHHSCGFVFFHPGVYKLDIQCRSTDYRGLGTLVTMAAGPTPTIGTTYPTGSPLKHSRRPAYSVSASPAIRGQWQGEENGHVWKCTPPIEISIIED